MPYIIQDGIMGISPIGGVDSAQRAPAGMIVHAVDTLLGGGEFIYLQGVANTVVGSVVTFDQQAKTTTLGAATANLSGPVAVATAAIGAGQWGWYQRSGCAVVSKTAAAISAGPVQLAANGQIIGGAAAGLTLENARAQAAGAGTTVANVQLSYPATTQS